MKATEFLSVYHHDDQVQLLAGWIRAPKREIIHVKGLSGSLDAVIFSAISKHTSTGHLVILRDKEEAAYFLNDLQSLLSKQELFLFPMSYKNPYEYAAVENANVLLRSEVLTHVSNNPASAIIVTYPEALVEKVINKRSLTANTLTVTKGGKLDMPFLVELLVSYDFEKSDFVFEAGQFAVRGGIIDVFSFAYDLPFRIELFGDEIESIRSFDPGSQLSVETLNHINLMPNVQTRMIQEERVSLLDFIDPSTTIWIK